VLERHRIADRYAASAGRAEIPVSELVAMAAGLSVSHSDPTFSSTDDIIKFIEAYADFVSPDPLRRRGTRLAQRDGPASSPRRRWRSRPAMSPSPPAPKRCHPAAGRSPVFQVHAADYRNPGQLPPGAVLVAGAGASGAQIAEELLQAGRRVYLSVGRHRRLPRRYRGRDLMWWLAEMNLDQVTPEERGRHD
jgi:putative flavoprotein involved in K+ transport